MDAEALVQLALRNLQCSQKELAVRVGVSPTQISKWKNGEHMSADMEARLRELVDLGDQNPEFVWWAGSNEKAKKWEKLIQTLADIAREGSETGYDTEPLKDDLGLLPWQTFHTLVQMGVTIPAEFPSELDFDYGREEHDDLWEALQTHQLASLISEIFRSLSNVYGFYAAYIYELFMDDDIEIFGTPAENLEACLIELAAAKLNVDSQMAPKFAAFRRNTVELYKNGLTILKDKAFRAGIPLRAELLDMVHSDHEGLGLDAERESLGINSKRLHPDIYMNELLCGMRAIHQVLPAIMKQLEIYEDFQLDTSEFDLKD